ncbi:FAD/NAD(P)-binding protein [Caulobacter sp. NIBR2454]|uniref:FAD/NAD(P)-binding protein n=1 Tax=Caulobacter sp. NIBR2454 TaxID=3015996 RepID=UPI0022B64F73|nr:FAD/NAD(P)-binding protein [Caulobacter sp. NIBR2454]
MTRQGHSALTVAVVGDGFSGVLLALKLRAAAPAARITVIGRQRRIGRGLAYGAADGGHMLNVPISRMDVGLEPSFHDWLRTWHGPDWSVDDFAPRSLFGDYMGFLADRAVDAGEITRIRGEAVGFKAGSTGSVILEDGRSVAADVTVLALGNLPPDLPGGLPQSITQSAAFVCDPWAPGALDDLPYAAPVMLVGSGLTMIDIALRLVARGHQGKMIAVSRRGLLPRGHQTGGEWPPFLHDHVGSGPLRIARLIRDQVRQATAAGVAWQRVFDAARPAVPAVWSAWTLAERRQFLRRLRPWWDVHRHRTAPAVTAAMQSLLAEGRLEVTAARFGAARFVEATAHIELLCTDGAKAVEVARVINCTGPGGRFDRTANPLIAHLRDSGQAQIDPLGLGFETRSGAVVMASGEVCDRLYAVGPLTKAAWWEITAAPEITIQIDDLVQRLTSATPLTPSLSASIFMDMGAGI